MRKECHDTSIIISPYFLTVSPEGLPKEVSSVDKNNEFIPLLASSEISQLHMLYRLTF